MPRTSLLEAKRVRRSCMVDSTSSVREVMAPKRAVKVCSLCHDQKLRCDIDTNGMPCSRCAARGDVCSIRARKSYPNRRKRNTNPRSTDEHREREQAPDSPESSSDQIRRVVTAAVTLPSSKFVPMFVGNGGYADILRTRGVVAPYHYLVPAELERSLAFEDLSYLKLKGCFSIPPEHRDLIKAYFLFVHPIFPIIDAAEFLTQYNTQGVDDINLMLVWSIFSIAANHVPQFRSVSVKETFIQRAKLLFDLSNENNKVVLVQSALLMSFWFGQAEDTKQSWYWTGIAFSMAQAAGFDQCVGGMPAPDIPRKEFLLWEEIWRCCLYRDVWLSFTMGRPLRLTISKSASLVGKESSFLFQGIALGDDEIFDVDDGKVLLETWQDLYLTSKILREAMQHEDGPVLDWTTKLTSMLDREPVSESSLPQNPMIDNHRRLNIHAVMIHLYRRTEDMAKLQNTVKDNVEIVRQIMTERTQVHIPPAAIPLLVPGMLALLHEKTSRDTSLGLQNCTAFDTYLEFLGGIEEYHPSAAIIKRLFMAARNG